MIRLLSLGLLSTAAYAKVSCDEITYSDKFTCGDDLKDESGWISTHNNQKVKYHVFTTSKTDESLAPLIVIHGGPGGSHLYMLPIKQLACTGRKVIMYDQAGSGESGILSPETNPWMIDVEYYAKEVDDIVNELKLGDFHILGHSWGGIVTQQYVLHHTPQTSSKLLSATHSSIFLNASTYGEGQKKLLENFPVHTRKVINNPESEDFEAVSGMLMSHFTCRTTPLPECVAEALGGINAELYIAMQGPSEFTISGVLGTWDTRNQHALSRNVKVPTLVTVGEHDTMHKLVVDEWRHEFASPVWKKKNVPSKISLIPNSGHMTMIDNNDAYLTEVDDFLRTAEKHHTEINAAMEVEHTKGFLRA